MTAYTLPQLEAMEPRELDAVVAEVVMGYVWKTCPGYDFPLLYRPDAEVDPDDWAFFDLLGEPHPDVMGFSTSWEGFGLIVQRMRELSITLDMTHYSGDESYVAAFTGKTHDRCVAEVYAPTLPRAVAIVAVLAVQGVKG